VGDLVALVTGASSDIGSAISHSLADTGVHVIASGRDETKLSLVARGRGSEIDIAAADLTTVSGRDAVRGMVAQRGRLDVLVLGSGIYERSAEADALRRQLVANVEAPYQLLQAVLPYLVASKGQVIFINSTQGLSASPGVGQFAATQHAMRAIADSLRGDALGVRVTSLFLGRTATARQQAIFAMEKRPYTPELLIQPADVANMVTSLRMLPRTCEVMEITMRPSVKSY
jgi:NADP-dependent 3-hydroxy acid dehydrogenase YdfG